jgi:hypothetical protein
MEVKALAKLVVVVDRGCSVDISDTVWTWVLGSGIDRDFLYDCGLERGCISCMLKSKAVFGRNGDVQGLLLIGNLLPAWMKSPFPNSQVPSLRQTDSFSSARDILNTDR